MLALRQMVEVAASIGAMILAAAHAMGADRAVLAERAGFDAARANDPDARISIGVETLLWDEGASLFGEWKVLELDPVAVDDNLELRLLMHEFRYPKTEDA